MTMPSSNVIGATTTLPPSSSVRAAVAATSSTWTTKTAYGGTLPPVLKMPPDGRPAEQRAVKRLGCLDIRGARLEPGDGVGCGHDFLHQGDVADNATLLEVRDTPMSVFPADFLRRSDPQVGAAHHGVRDVHVQVAGGA